MAVKVLIPTPLRQFTGKQSSIECSAATVGEALGSLTGTFSELKKHLFTDDGKIRSFVNVYLNDEDIRFLNKENTPTKDGDTISIVPSIAGGSSSAGDFVLRRQANRPVAKSLSGSLTHSRRRE
ncbi:MAG TPA: MoaD/ThiS family protein [Verrucomicrobiae bacterium]|nr:MoaD/ThiS family protein [Verrucomicrobiae bacterium]